MACCLVTACRGTFHCTFWSTVAVVRVHAFNSTVAIVTYRIDCGRRLYNNVLSCTRRHALMQSGCNAALHGLVAEGACCSCALK